ncbi:MAG: hypothetical protein KGK17_11210 [Betaproteobacteria bacterium]|nr:hypothetical protein [Betaproteobacteria bacterium]
MPLPDPRTTPLPGPITPLPVRSPKPGQEWVYTLRNVFNGQVVDVVTETVVAVGDQVRIRRSSSKAGILMDEIQNPWGMILQDPHWEPPQLFTAAIPLWPEQLKAGWSGEYRRRYQVVGVPDYDYDWILSMEALAWEEITVPAGKFQALKFSNRIRFQSYEFYYRLFSERMETLWLVPGIGRWAVRRSAGTYYIEGKGSRMREDDLEWELMSWK